MEPELSDDWVEDALTQEQALIASSLASPVAVTSAWSPTLAAAWQQRDWLWLTSASPGLVLAAATLPMGLAATLTARGGPSAALPLVVLTGLTAVMTSLLVRVDIAHAVEDLASQGAPRRSGMVTAAAVSAAAFAGSQSLAAVALWALSLTRHVDTWTETVIWLSSVPMAAALSGLAWPATYLAMAHDRGPFRAMAAALRVTGRKAPAWMALGVLAQAWTLLALAPGWFGIVELWRRGLTPYTSPMVLGVTLWTVFVVPWCLGAAELLFTTAWRRDTGA